MIAAQAGNLAAKPILDLTWRPVARIILKVCENCTRAVTCLTNNRHADVAQSAEQLSCKQQVIGSSPIVGSAGVTESIVGIAGAIGHERRGRRVASQ